MIKYYLRPLFEVQPVKFVSLLSTDVEKKQVAYSKNYVLGGVSWFRQ